MCSAIESCAVAVREFVSSSSELKLTTIGDHQQTGSSDLLTFSDCMEALKDNQGADPTETVSVGKMGQRMPIEAILLKATVLLSYSESSPVRVSY